MGQSSYSFYFDPSHLRFAKVGSRLDQILDDLKVAIYVWSQLTKVIAILAVEKQNHDAMSRLDTLLDD